MVEPTEIFDKNAFTWTLCVFLWIFLSVYINHWNYLGLAIIVILTLAHHLDNDTILGKKPLPRVFKEPFRMPLHELLLYLFTLYSLGFGLFIELNSRLPNNLSSSLLVLLLITLISGIYRAIRSIITYGKKIYRHNNKTGKQVIENEKLSQLSTPIRQRKTILKVGKVTRKEKKNYIAYVFLIFIAAFLTYLLLGELYSILSSVVHTYTIAGCIVLIIIVLYYILYGEFGNILKWSFSLPYVVFPGVLVIAFYIIYLLWSKLSSWYLWLIVPVGAICCIICASYMESIKFQPNIKLLQVIVLALLFTLTGLWVIEDYTMQEKFRLGLQFNQCDKINNQWIKIPYSDLTCKGAQGDIFVGAYVDCALTIRDINNITGYYTLYYFNGTANRTSFTGKSFSFIAPSMLSRYEIHVRGIDALNNQSMCASSGWDITFPTYDDYKKEKLLLGATVAGFLVFVFTQLSKIISKFAPQQKK